MATVAMIGMTWRSRARRWKRVRAKRLIWLCSCTAY
jgi:hypothetical protein